MTHHVHVYLHRTRDAIVHSPTTGQFTSGQHAKAAVYHQRMQAYHASGSTSGHAAAAKSHGVASQHHATAAKSGLPADAAKAHAATKVAMEATKKARGPTKLPHPDVIGSAVRAAEGLNALHERAYQETSGKR